MGNGRMSQGDLGTDFPLTPARATLETLLMLFWVAFLCSPFGENQKCLSKRALCRADLTVA